MKKLVMIALGASFILNSFAQQKKKEEVSALAKSAFTTKFPDAQKIKWSIEKPGEYEAEFLINGVETSAVFDASGKFIESETAIKESELAQPIKATLAKDFANYKLEEIEKSTDAKGTVTYEIAAKKDKKEYEIVFDKNGKLLNLKEETEDKEKD